MEIPLESTVKNSLEISGPLISIGDDIMYPESLCDNWVDHTKYNYIFTYA